MERLQIAFAGIGSIGTRHLKNVHTYLKEKDIPFEIDVFRSGKGKPLTDEQKQMISSVYTDEPRNVGKNYDIVFVTNPTSMHRDTLKAFKDYSKAFFIEKPLFDTSEISKDFLLDFSEKTCYVACPLRFNPVLQYVKNNIKLDTVFSARAISSSYLPDWRPGTDYRECYSAHESMGGGVHLDLIHEWDYLTWFFGEVREGFSIIDRISSLEIDSKDAAVYIGRTDKTLIELHLDYYGRKAVRNLTLYMPDETVECDIQNGVITYLKSGEVIKVSAERNAYQMAEIEHFFNIYFGKIPCDNDLIHASNVLKYTRGEF